nr:hypothetical protein CFP56_17912 [Quercus suber]
MASDAIQAIALYGKGDFKFEEFPEVFSKMFEYLWEGVKRLGKLKFIDLSSSRNFIRTPDFSGVPGLVELKLSGGVAFIILYRYLQGLLCRKTVNETSTKRKEDEGINLLIHCG